MPSKNELEKRVEELRAENEAQRARLSMLGVQTGPCWLIETPNRQYRGQLYGVQFVAGTALLDGVEANRQTALKLERDHGYKVTWLSGAEVDAEKARLKELADEPEDEPPPWAVPRNGGFIGDAD